MKRSTFRQVLAGSLLGLLLCPLSRAAAPRDELLRLVPDDVAFCLVVQDLRGHGEGLLASPFVQQLQKSPLGLALRSADEAKKLAELEKQLHQALGLDWTRLRDDVFGDAVVLAYRAGPAGGPKQDQDLVLVRARDEKLLAELVARLNKAQKDMGELKEVEVREHGGRKYFRRVEKQQENYCYLRGPVLALSTREEMLLQAIDRDREDGAAEPAAARELRLLGVDGKFAALWVNPRAFDADVGQKAAAAGGREAAVLRAFHTHWKELEGVAVALDLREEAELTLAVRARTERLPPATRRLLAEAARPSDLWDRFPDDALLAASVRLDPSACLDVLGAFLTDEDRQALHDALDRYLAAPLGRDSAGEVLPFVGPEWGVCVTAPPADAAWFPQVVAAVRVRPGDKAPPVDQALFAAVHALGQMAVLDYNGKNKDRMSLRTLFQGRTEVRYLEGGGQLPPGLRPAFALHDGYLVLASSPEAVRRFAGLGPARPAPVAAEFPLLRLSLKDLRQYVKDRREPLAQAVAEKNEIPRDEAEHRLDGLLAGLQLLDRVELTQRPAPGQVTLSLRVRTALRLRK